MVVHVLDAVSFFVCVLSPARPPQAKAAACPTNQQQLQQFYKSSGENKVGSVKLDKEKWKSSTVARIVYSAGKFIRKRMLRVDQRYLVRPF